MCSIYKINNSKSTKLHNFPENISLLTTRAHPWTTLAEGGITTLLAGSVDGLGFNWPSTWGQTARSSTPTRLRLASRLRPKVVTLWPWSPSSPLLVCSWHIAVESVYREPYERLFQFATTLVDGPNWIAICTAVPASSVQVPQVQLTNCIPAPFSQGETFIAYFISLYPLD